MLVAVATHMFTARPRRCPEQCRCRAVHHSTFAATRPQCGMLIAAPAIISVPAHAFCAHDVRMCTALRRGLHLSTVHPILDPYNAYCTAARLMKGDRREMYRVRDSCSSCTPARVTSKAFAGPAVRMVDGAAIGAFLCCGGAASPAHSQHYTQPGSRPRQKVCSLPRTHRRLLQTAVIASC